MKTLRAILLAVAVMPAVGPASAGAAPSENRPRAGEKEASAVPDFQPEALWDGRKIVPFKALDDPKMLKASEAEFLDDDEYVLGVTVNGESRAYPTRFVWWHHVVNDRVGETRFAVTYCSVCNTGIRFDPVVDGKPITLDFYGLYSGVVALCDRETGSVWPQISGRAVQGPLAGKRLRKQPVLDTTWKEWKRLHPDTRVMSPDTPYAKFYRPKGQPEPRGYERFPAPFFRPTVTRGDRRLPPFEKVLGVVLPLPPEAGKGPDAWARRAYPIRTLKVVGEVLNDTVEGEPIAVFLEPQSVTAAALSRTLEGRTLTFESRKLEDGKTAIFDRETGTRWSLEGKGEEGPLAGKSLTPVENHLSQWYGWAAYYPDTSIYGRTEPPQPGNPFDEGGDKPKKE